MLKAECSGDPLEFDEKYPHDEASAFLSSGRPRFNIAGLKYLEGRARSFNPKYGIISKAGEDEQASYAWIECEKHESNFRKYQEPRPDYHYLISVDTMTGASQVGGKDPDSHSVIVWKQGFMDSRGWHPPMDVAKINTPCFHDMDMLEEHIVRLAKYYGNCLIVPEINMDRGLVELLKKRGGMKIYQREVFNQREKRLMESYGWQTTNKTREMIIEKMATAIRCYDEEGGGVLINDLDIIKECKNFIVKENGRSEAGDGFHDDDVLSSCIGLMTIDLATLYEVKFTYAQLPRDLASLERDEDQNFQYS